MNSSVNSAATENILLLYPDLKPGGAAKLMIMMANSINAPGKNVFVCSSGGQLEKDLEDSILHVRYDFKAESGNVRKLFKYIAGALFLLSVIKRKKISIVVNHHRYFSPMLFLIKKITKIRVVFNSAATHKPMPGLKGRLLGDNVIAVSDGVKAHLIKEHGVTEERIKVIYNGIPGVLSLEAAEILDIKKSLNIENKKVACCIGHFRKLKRQDFLLSVWREIALEYSDVHLILLGYGETAGELNKYIAENNLTGSVSLFENSIDPVIALNISDVFVLPSQREGLPIVLLEAFSLGKPAIGTDTSGINEVIRNNENGYLFGLNDRKALQNSLVSLLVDRKDYEKFSFNAQKDFTEKFRYEIYKKEILQYFISYTQ